MREMMKVLQLGLLLIGVTPDLVLGQPTSVSYQGQLEKDGRLHDGQADFKFVIVDGETSLWSHDGSSVDGAEPTGLVTLDVTQGLFHALLGSGGMEPLTSDHLEGADNPQLRIWVRAPAGDPAGFEQLTDQEIASVPFSLRAGAGGAGDECHWETNGTDVYRTTGNIGVGTDQPETALHLSGDSDITLELPPEGDLDHASVYFNLGDHRIGRIYGHKMTDQLHLEGNSGIELTTDSVDRVWINESGYVGVGVEEPAAALDVARGPDWTTLNWHKSIRLTGGGAIDFATNEKKFGIGATAASNALHFFWTDSDGTEDAPHYWMEADADIPIVRFRTDLRVFGSTKTEVLEVTGADVAERFPTSEQIEPGMVVVIDSDAPGELCVSRRAYDRRVAGVVSGAKDLQTGAILGNLPGHGDFPPVALGGRVWVRCDASMSAIEPGDLLTTSTVPGHAMKAIDRERSHGAILGKAMTALKQGQGYVLVLVNLH